MSIDYSDECNKPASAALVSSVKEQFPDEDAVIEAAELFKVFGDSTRAKIICALSLSEMCVCDIAALLNMTVSAISHQLRILKHARVVKNRRDGKAIYYRLDDKHIAMIFNMAMEHIMEEGN